VDSLKAPDEVAFMTSSRPTDLMIKCMASFS